MPDIMKWYYNSWTGAVTESLQAWADVSLLKTGTGWHGPFNTREDALAFYEANKADNPGWRAPTGVIGNIENAITAPTAIAGEAVSSPFVKNANVLFLRIGEIVLGLILIGVGLAKLTGTTNAIAKLAKTAIKAKV